MTGLRQFTPPSMKGLNYNIDADLDLGVSHGIKTDWLSTSNVGLPLTLKPGATSLCFEDDNHHIAIYGGRFVSGAGAVIDIVGSLLGGYLAIFTPNAAKNADIQVLEVHGNTDTPYLNMISHRIAALSQATTDMDAAPVTKMWGAWTPTLTWTGGTPTGITKNGRYCRIANVVHFDLLILATGNVVSSTALTITPPVTPANNSKYPACSAWEQVIAAFSNPIAYVNESTALIAFLALTPSVNGQAFNIEVTGTYEV